MKPFLLTALLFPSAVFAVEPFLVFASDQACTDSTLTSVIAKYLTTHDYLSRKAVTQIPSLSQVVEPDHTVLLDTSLAEVHRDLAPNTVVYYQEAPQNPVNEAADLIGTFGAAAGIVHGTPGARFGILPGVRFFGYTGHCGFDPKAGLRRSLDWTQIDYLSIQGDGLLADKCIGTSSEKDYAALVATVVSFVRRVNPSIVITAQLSFRDTSPADMLKAAGILTPLVDGFFFSYPLNPAMEHKYSNAQSLEAVLRVLRPGRM